MILPRKSAAGIVYWVVNTWRGKRVWERVGPVKREAQAVDERNKKAIKAGTFAPKSSARVSTGSYIETWASTRKNVNAAKEAALLDRHIVNRPGFGDVPLAHLRPLHILDLIESLKTSKIGGKGNEGSDQTLSIKHIANIYGLVRKALRDARVREIILSDPCEPVRAGLTQKGKRRRTLYTLPEITALLSDAVDSDMRMWNAIAFYTGMRTGEICGLKWSDYDDSAIPLGSLHVDTQYNGRKLKTERVRNVPVHSELARALAWWKREGFEFAYTRKPTRDDFIVPHREDHGAAPHTESSSYKQWLRALAQADVENRGGKHTTRHTFITMAQRGGADKDLVTLVTHNPKGAMIDQYTHWDWDPLCAAVESLTKSLQGVTISRENECRRRESKSRPGGKSEAFTGIDGNSGGARSPENSRQIEDLEVQSSASQRSAVCPTCGRS